MHLIEIHCNTVLRHTRKPPFDLDWKYTRLKYYFPTPLIDRKEFIDSKTVP